ncbi:MAG: hypothetical protein J5I93_21200, partial [Pirellulaceae bacterium]|nr:hypothetical protein [Pirellulaceae bacterium]
MAHKSWRSCRTSTGRQLLPAMAARLRPGLILLVGTVLPAIGLGWTPATLQAQQPVAPAAGAAGYEQLDVHPRMVGDDKDSRNLRATVDRDVRAVLRGTAQLAEKQSLFDGWFNAYYFPSMTRLDRLGEIAQLRVDLFDDYIRDARSNEAHDHLVNNLALPAMKRLVEGNFHPAVRYNAMLVIADLNSREAVTLGTKQPPEPLPQALTYMLAALEQPGQPDAVRIAALYGLRRHAELDRLFPQYQPLPANIKQQVAAAMESIAASQDPPQGANRTAEGQAWLRRMALETLATLGDTGENHKYVTLIGQTVADQAALPSLRCTAARSLGRFDYTSATGLDGVAMAQDLGGFAADACRQELARIEADQKRREEKKKAAQGGGGFSVPGMGPPGMMPPGMGPPGMGPPGMPGAEGPPGGADPGMPDGGMPGMSGLFGPPSANAQASAEEDRDIQRTRRLLKFQIYCVQQG